MGRFVDYFALRRGANVHFILRKKIRKRNNSLFWILNPLFDFPNESHALEDILDRTQPLIDEP